MFYVYILRSLSFPDQKYVGFTTDLNKRIVWHNRGLSSHTSKYRPWELLWFCAFKEKSAAKQFEGYLKTHSGKAFSKKHLISCSRQATAGKDDS